MINIIKNGGTSCSPTLSLVTLVSKLFVHLEFGAAILEEFADLVGSGDTGVDVGLFGLGTHLLGGGEVAALESLELGIGIGHDVGDEFQVLALFHQLQQGLHSFLSETATVFIRQGLRLINE